MRDLTTENILKLATDIFQTLFTQVNSLGPTDAWWANIGSGNGTKSLPEQMLTSYQLGSLTIRADNSIDLSHKLQKWA